MQCPRCQQENPTSHKFCRECGTPLRRTNASGSPGASYADLERALIAAHAQVTEALEQQTATREILRVISSSPTDVEPVFQTILSSTNRLCEASFSVLWLWDGEALISAAHANVSPELAERLRTSRARPRRGGSPVALAALEQAVIHVPDVLDDPRFSPADVPSYQLEGARSILAVPMLREGTLVGVINTWRREPRAFTDRQVELLKTFADQAVIAIENVRLFTELQVRNRQLTESLDQQTATSEILRTIAHAQTDTQPVFDTIVRSAARLCHAANAALFLTHGGMLYEPANYGSSPEALAATRARYPRPVGMDTTPGMAILTRSVVHVPDTEDPSAIEHVRQGARLLGFRGLVTVPMLREGEPVGAIIVTHRDPGLFSDGEVELLKTFADQAVIAVENVRLFKELEEKNRALTEAHAQVTETLGQQTATAEILRVMSGSPTDVQPVMNAVVEAATRLTEADRALIGERAGDSLYWLASHGGPISGTPIPISRALPTGRAILDRRTTQEADIHMLANQFPHLAALQDIRTALATPLLREGVAVGVLLVNRREVRPFTDKQIGLLETFADQAVIAIENVRLFKELEARNRDLTATSEILRVISRSPTDVQPVFDVVAESAARLCESFDSTIYRLDGDRLLLVAHHGLIQVAVGVFSLPVVRGTGAGRAVLAGRAVHVADAQAEVDEFPESSENARRAGFRTMLCVPLMRDGVAIGAIALRRTEVRLFTDRQIALLQTFADQAVIAIENVRLFTELQASNRELTTALDTQTATSDILRVISRSQTDVQPVFDAIVASAVRLLGAYSGVLTRIKGDQIELGALTSTNDAGDAAARALYPEPLQSGRLTARAIRERAPLNVADAHTDRRLPEAEDARARVRGYRSLVVVPMLRDDEAVGAIAVTRREAGGFTDDEIALLKTFADQAVIAIENARLLSELQARTQELTRSVDELQALSEVSQALSSTLDLEAVLNTIVSRASQLAGAAGCSIYEYDEAAEQFDLRATYNYDAEFVEALRARPLRRGEGLMGRAAEMREPAQIPDIAQPGAYQSSLREPLIRFGYRALLSVPLLREDQIIGSLSFNRKAPGEFPPEVVEVLKTFATQSALAIQNARLFREIADKSRQLEVASQHKSEFLANMSHELRTPLNAIIGFSEVLAQGMFGAVNDKQTEYLRDILESGRHLLSLINDILDLSKIEAGRMELELTDFDLPQAIQNALTLVRERALRRGIALHHAIDDRVADIRADERKVKQVLLNLLSNAIKFTSEGGRIEVRAAPADGRVEVSVTDTGIGIAPEDLETVFEEFRQVGTADKKAEGTGLGLALTRKFIELHGGRIWVTSQVGVGSTFTFTLPVRPWPAS